MQIVFDVGVLLLATVVLFHVPFPGCFRKFKIAVCLIIMCISSDMCGQVDGVYGVMPRTEFELADLLVVWEVFEIHWADELDLQRGNVKHVAGV